MSEPTSGVIGGVVMATGAITLTGSIFGLQYDALLCGLFGGMISLMHLPASHSKFQTAGTLAAAAVTGALFAPVAVAGGLNYAEWLAKVPADALRLAMAGAIGLFGQAAVPLVLKVMGRKADQT